MTNYLSVELEQQRRRDLDRVAGEGAKRRRWALEAREARSGRPVNGTGATGEFVFWALPDWVPAWKAEGETT